MKETEQLEKETEKEFKEIWNNFLVVDRIEKNKRKTLGVSIIDKRKMLKLFQQAIRKAYKEGLKDAKKPKITHDRGGGLADLI